MHFMNGRFPVTTQRLKLPLLAGISGLARRYRLPFMLLVLHAPVGLVLMQNANLAAFHAYATLALGIYWAVTKQKSLEQISWLAAYIIGSEVLWRMAEAPIYWEYGKYSTGLVLITALVSRKKFQIPKLPLVYFLLLLPAGLVTFLSHNLMMTKDRLSFNLSGPFLLLVCCWFFANLKLSWFQLKKLLFWLMVPLATVALVTLFYTVTAENITFTGESNHGTSGGFGPNQVSAMLGLGMFLSLTCYLVFKNSFREKILFGVLAVFFAAQSVMTFSRGGVYNAGGAVLCVMLFQMRSASRAIKQLLAVAVIVTIFMVAVFPRMNEFTGGALQERFESTETTGRFEITEADLMIFLDNPVWGAGVGEAFFYRAQYFGRVVAAHTEFTRMIAEHGIFGVFSLLLLMLAVLYAFRRQETAWGRAVTAGFITWSFLFMLNTGMRLAGPSFVLGLCFIVFTNLRMRRRKLVRFGPRA